MIRRPLDFLPSIKLKLGAIIVGVRRRRRRRDLARREVRRLAVPHRRARRCPVARDGAGARARDDLAAARDVEGGRGDVARRLRPARHGDVERRGRRPRTRVQRDGGAARRGRPRPARPRRERVPRAAHADHRAARRAREPRRRRRTYRSGHASGRCSDRSSGSAASSTQLLDLSKLESGAVPLNRQRFRVRPLLDQAVREARLHAPETLELEVHADETLEANADPERVHQVVANLLENAVRHSPPSGRVLVGRPRRQRRAVHRGDGRRAGRPVEARRSGSSSASTARTRRGRAAKADPGSVSRSRGGSSTCTAA